MLGLITRALSSGSQSRYRARKSGHAICATSRGPHSDRLSPRRRGHSSCAVPCNGSIRCRLNDVDPQSTYRRKIPTLAGVKRHDLSGTRVLPYPSEGLGPDDHLPPRLHSEAHGEHRGLAEEQHKAEAGQRRPPARRA